MIGPRKDPKTGGVINVDAEALNKYKIERKYYRRVEVLQKDIIEIKECIAALHQRIENLESK